MTLPYRVEIRGTLPGGLPGELRRRFGDVAHRTEDDRTVLTHPGLDQAALRALLGALWDVDGELRLVTAIDDDPNGEQQ